MLILLHDYTFVNFSKYPNSSLFKRKGSLLVFMLDLMGLQLEVRLTLY